MASDPQTCRRPRRRPALAARRLQAEVRRARPPSDADEDLVAVTLGRPRARRHRTVGSRTDGRPSSPPRDRDPSPRALADLVARRTAPRGRAGAGRPRSRDPRAEPRTPAPTRSRSARRRGRPAVAGRPRRGRLDVGPRPRFAQALDGRHQRRGAYGQHHRPARAQRVVARPVRARTPPGGRGRARARSPRCRATGSASRRRGRWSCRRGARTRPRRRAAPDGLRGARDAPRLGERLPGPHQRLGRHAAEERTFASDQVLLDDAPPRARPRPRRPARPHRPARCRPRRRRSSRSLMAPSQSRCDRRYKAVASCADAPPGPRARSRRRRAAGGLRF